MNKAVPLCQSPTLCCKFTTMIPHQRVGRALAVKITNLVDTLIINPIKRNTPNFNLNFSTFCIFMAPLIKAARVNYMASCRHHAYIRQSKWRSLTILSILYYFTSYPLSPFNHHFISKLNKRFCYKFQIL